MINKEQTLSPEEPNADFYTLDESTRDANAHLDTKLRLAERTAKRKDIDPQYLDLHGPCNKVLSGDVPVKLLQHYRNRAGQEMPVYELLDHPGFIYVPDALGEHEQQHWTKRTFEEFLNPPHPSNMNSVYSGDTRDPSEFNIIDPNNRTCPCRLERSSTWCSYAEHVIKAIPITYCRHSNKITLTRIEEIEQFVRKIRWSTLGLTYNWTSKQYDRLSKNENSGKVDDSGIPEDLTQFARSLVQGCLDSCSDFTPQAGIVNYYQPGDTMTCHVDRSEPYMAAPLVSISLGLEAIFLIGGKSRDHSIVTPVLVKSGDVSFLTGPARYYFHGVPRIFEGTEPKWLFDSPPSCLLLHNARINLNLRQVFDQGVTLDQGIQ